MSWLSAARPAAGPRAFDVSVKPFSVAVLSGLLTALCLPRPGLCLLAWFSLAPLLGLWSGSAPGRAFGTGWAAGLAFHGLALYWIYPTCRFAGIGVPVALLAWSCLALFLGLAWGLAGAFGAWSTGTLPRPWRPWAWAMAWTALSVVWERWTPRLGADLLAYTQYRHLSLLQAGSLLGPHGLGFLIVAANASLSQAWEDLDRGARPNPANPAVLLALLALAWAWGFGLLTLRAASAPWARIEILQPNIEQYRKWDEGFEEEIRRGFAELLSLPRPESPHLVVWPEAALPRWVEEGRDIPEAAEWSRRLGAFQVLGAVSRGPKGPHNSVFLVGPEGRVRGSYHKRELVPFGEYVPLRFLRRFIGILNQLGGLAAGEPLQPLWQTPLGPTAAGICYEAVFPRWARADAGRGARLLVNVTNDGWYKDTWGPFQHFQTNVFRAIENRVAVIRSGNTGISGVIDPWGVVTASLGLGERGRLDAQLPLEDPFPRRSFYARHGDWLGLLCLLASLAIAGAKILRSGKT